MSMQLKQWVSNLKVRIPSVLYSYSKGQKYVEVSGETVSEVLNNLDDKFPGIKFRFIDEHDKIRPHMNLFLNKEHIKDIDHKVSDSDELFIAQSLSGG